MKRIRTAQSLLIVAVAFLMQLGIIASLIGIRLNIGTTWVRVEQTDIPGTLNILHLFDQSETFSATFGVPVDLFKSYLGRWWFIAVYAIVASLLIGMQARSSAIRAIIWSAINVTITNVVDLLFPDSIDINYPERMLLITLIRSVSAICVYSGIVIFALHIGSINTRSFREFFYIHSIFISIALLTALILKTGNIYPNASLSRSMNIGWNLVGTIALPLSITIAIYRRRRISDINQRQQLRIFIVGASFIGLFNVIVGRVPSIFGYPPLIDNNFSQVIDSLFPILLALTIIRYRLFNVDALVARFLIYSLLSISIAGIYGLLIGITTYLFGPGDRSLWFIIATIIISVGYTPARFALQKLADRLIYGSYGDPNNILLVVGRLLAADKSPDYAIQELVQIIPNLFNVQWARIQSDYKDLVYSSQTLHWMGQYESIPMIHSGERIGNLEVSTNPSKVLHETEIQALAIIAKQAAILLANVRLDYERKNHPKELSLARKQELLRIRSSLHDDTLPLLNAVHHKLNVISRQLDDNQAPVIASLIDTERILMQAQKGVRELSYQIWPPILDILGLLPALKHLLQSVKEANPEIQFIDDFPESLHRYPPEIEFVVYRIVEQSLINSVKHSQTDSITLAIHETQAQLILKISDNGIGMQYSREGIGLQNLRAVTNEVEGKIYFESGTDFKGTCVRAILPLSDKGDFLTQRGIP